LASLRQRLSQLMVLSTIQRLGRTTKVLAASDRLTILRFTWPHDALKRRLELRSLIAAIRLKLEKKGIEAEQTRHHENAAIAILNVGSVNDGVH
jgi:hypothetical protein